MNGSGIAIGDIVSVLEEKGLFVSLSQPEGAAGLDTPLAGCTFDSREVKPGYLFFAKGIHFHPRYLTGAVEAGAACYVANEQLADELKDLPAARSCLGIVVTDVRLAMAAIPPVFYDHPDRDLTIVGVTGTKGKSSTTVMLRTILKAEHRSAGIMGSILNDDGIENFEAFNTTPEAPELWRHLDNCRKAGHKAMLLEVSSQALKYNRVLGVPFSIACFTNISRDHISPVEHRDFADYLASKLRIFERCHTAVVNLGTDHLDEVMAAAKQAERVVTIGVEHPEADACATNIHSDETDAVFALTLSPALSETVGEPQTVEVQLGMPGTFNVENALTAIACARIMGVPMEYILEGLLHVHVPGRMDMIRSKDGQVIGIVDFAHNKYSYEAIFGYVHQEYPEHTIVSIFGARGDKAQERRHECPEVASRYSDLMILSEEDPAHEDVLALCEEVASHLPAGANYEIQVDRELAVKRAFEYARGHRPAVVLLLAKGAETHQQRGDNFVTVKSDMELAKEFIEG